ncbi:hypothetical protein NE237_009067 [Protea cynaroides]|uniref:Uncharacterized protein n=1 Tax=Protea cynaroides TaxID=273540 RepID=A0A9Q0KX30_9MAGN|nr:hypothetical protein NE237_009067 [Protea cynaroides]
MFYCIRSVLQLAVIRMEMKVLRVGRRDQGKAMKDPLSVAESALVRVVVAGGYDNGGYGVAQANSMAAKVNQCDEICGNSCDNSRIYISNLPPDVPIDKLREFFGDWKLTPTEHHEKKERKLVEDSNTLKTLVLVYWINDMSHSHTHLKDDVISDGISEVIVEDGGKSIKRHGKVAESFLDSGGEQDPSLHVVAAASSVTDDGMDEGVILVSQRWVMIAGSKVDGMTNLALDGHISPRFGRTNVATMEHMIHAISHVSLRWLVDSGRNAWKVAVDRGLSATACLVAAMTGVATPLPHVVEGPGIITCGVLSSCVGRKISQV